MNIKDNNKINIIHDKVTVNEMLNSSFVWSPLVDKITVPEHKILFILIQNL